MMDHGGGDTAAGGGSSGGGGSGGDGGGVRDFGVPPPFLTRIFSMVNDPNTNSFISWSPSGTSFIVWDHIQFSAKLLPQYFKHSNFSSFIYQLNNYGFRKIGVEHQWEYENQYFQAGKEHLLQKIRSRSQRQEASNKQKRTRKPCLALNKYEMELVLNNLRDSNSELKQEIYKLKQKRQHMETQIIAFNEQHADSLNKSKNVLILLAKALDEISVQPVTKERDHGDDNGSRKKPRMENTATTNEALDAINEEIGTPVEEHNKVDLISEESEKESNDYKFWKKLLEEDDTDENGAKEIVSIKQQPKIELELENLI